RPGFWEHHGHQLTSYARSIYDGGRRALAWQYRQALNEAQDYARAVQSWFDGFDLVISELAPEAPMQPAGTADAGLGPRYPIVTAWNLAGHPAASVPMGYGPNGLPVAVQLVARHRDDARLLAVAAALEQQLPWADRWPENLCAATQSR